MKAWAQPSAAGADMPEGFTLEPWACMSLDIVRAMLRRVGADCLLFLRLFVVDDEQAATLSS
ncbi:hypothetical protein [Acidovorax facilis]|jgi:hypothetical protein|uniref:hypothetical protein n=1 Tax=Acidovorax facilis TaxID=12917 RepID=UPI003D647073